MGHLTWARNRAEENINGPPGPFILTMATKEFFTATEISSPETAFSKISCGLHMQLMTVEQVNIY